MKAGHDRDEWHNMHIWLLGDMLNVNGRKPCSSVGNMDNLSLAGISINIYHRTVSAKSAFPCPDHVLTWMYPSAAARISASGHKAFGWSKQIEDLILMYSTIKLASRVFLFHTQQYYVITCSFFHLVAHSMDKNYGRLGHVSSLACARGALLI